MPTNSQSINWEDSASQVLQQLTNEQTATYRRQTMVRPRTSNSWSVNLYETSVPPTLADNKAKERGELKQLVDTGQSSLKMYAEGNTLAVQGFNMNGEQILFLLDRNKLIAPKKRTSHLKALLAKLAKREGAELELVDKLPTWTGRQILYWPFKLKVDDSALLMAKPRQEAEKRAEQRTLPDFFLNEINGRIPF